MRDLETVLRQKEQDIVRVCKEIQALRTVIPLLADTPLSWDELQTYLLDSCSEMEQSRTEWQRLNCIIPGSGICDTQVTCRNRSMHSGRNGIDAPLNVQIETRRMNF